MKPTQKPLLKTDTIAEVLPANILTAAFRIRGTAPLVQHRFWKKAEMMTAMATAAVDKKSAKATRKVRDYEQEFQDAQHITADGWNGVPCAAFRSAMIDACRTVKLVMTRSKMAVFVVPDGFDVRDGTPLSRIVSGSPEAFTASVRNDNGSVDIRVRPMWREWEVDVRCQWDADMISASSVLNLLDRAGRQVGVGEGRPYSKDGCGQGWGTFTIVTEGQ